MIWDDSDTIDQKLGGVPAATELPTTWSDTLAPVAQAGLGLLNEVPPAIHEIAQPGFLDRTGNIIGAATKAAFENAPIMGDNNTIEMQYQPVIEAINKGRDPGDMLPNPYLYSATNPFMAGRQLFSGQPVTRSGLEDLVWQRMGQLRTENPGLAGNLPASRDEMMENVRTEQRTSQDYADMLAQDSGGPIGQYAAPLVGQGVGGAADPENVLGMAFGLPASASVARAFLQEGAVNAGITALTLPFQLQHQKDLGQPMSAGDAATEVLGAGLIGGTIGAGAKLLHRLWEPAGRMAPDVPASVRAAATNLEDHINRGQDNPFSDDDPGRDANRQSIVEATDALQDGNVAALPATRAPIVRGADISLEAAQRKAGFQIQSRDPRTVVTDASTMQYKGGADDKGVTDRLAGVEQWDPAKAGLSLWYERQDGSVIVADGHQRLGLAQRMSDQAGAAVPYFGVTYREADGVTPEQMRAIAALKNIAEGSGSSVDAARVLRDAPEGVTQLPPRSPLVRQARDLMSLGDTAWGMTVNGQASERDGAIVGRHVKDPNLQAAILAHLSKDTPETATEAELFVRQALAAGATHEVQDDMFGSFLKTDLIFPQRVKILTAALSQLRKDKAPFATLNEKAGTIREAGNRLNMAENQARQETAARAFATVAALAERKGPISDALQAAAQDAVRTGNRRGATQQFLQDVRGRLERGELDGEPVGGAVGPLEPETAPAAISARDRPDGELERGLEKFSDPVAKPEAFRQQTNDLAREIAPPPEEKPEPAPPAAAEKPKSEFGDAKPVIEAMRRLPDNEEIPAGDLFGKGEDSSITAKEARAELERQARAVERLRGCVEDPDNAV